MSTRFLAALFCVLTASAFAVAAPDPASTDDAVEMVLSVDENGTTSAWTLPYGQARQQALEHLRAGRHEQALAAARMQFMLCPLESTSTDLAIQSVRQMLVAVDGTETRADHFERFARLGPSGPDSALGTADDLADPLADVALADFARPDEYYADCDAEIDARAAVTATWEKAWYQTEKAFIRLAGADFDTAASILVATLSEEIKLPFAPAGSDSWELQRIQDIIDRIHAGLGVAYRGRTGTLAGVHEFIAACMDYARYGPPGPDDKMGTTDDLKPPI